MARTSKEKPAKTRATKTTSIRDQISKIRAKLGHATLEWKPRAWLDTGMSDLNAVLGRREKGIPYGSILELSGWESQGKTALALSLAALAQQQGAGIIWDDFETSFDEDWARERGLDVENIFLIQPYVGSFKKKKKKGEEKEVEVEEDDDEAAVVVKGKNLRLANAQELCAETEEGIKFMASRFEKLFLVVDSIPSMLSEGEASAGLEGSNMRTNMDLPMFLGRLLRRWTGLAQAHNIIIVLINQLRQSPKAYGDPVYTPGGNAVRFYCHIRVRLKRARKGTMKEHGKTVGIKGIITNKKNKAGSVEGCMVGFKLPHKGPMEFLDAMKLKAEDVD